MSTGATASQICAGAAINPDIATTRRPIGLIAWLAIQANVRWHVSTPKGSLPAEPDVLPQPGPVSMPLPQEPGFYRNPISLKMC